jgi:hypothetical protein
VSQISEQSGPEWYYGRALQFVIVATDKSSNEFVLSDSNRSALSRQLQTAVPCAARRFLLHQQHGAAAFDFARDLAMHVRRHTGHASRQDFATLGHELFQQIRIFVIDRFARNINAAPRHSAISTTESGAAFGSLGLH